MRPLYHRDRIVDVGIAAVLLVGAGITITLSVDVAPTPVWFKAAWAALITVPLVWRRRFPIPSAAVVILAFLIGQVTVTPEPLISQIAPLLALYSVGAWVANRRHAHIARAIFVVAIVAVAVAMVIIAPARLSQQLGNLSASTILGLAALANAVYLGAAIGFGNAAWRSARRRAVLEVRTEELELERQRSATQAVALERVRIARELHDVIAHHVSVMGIQAGAARRVLRSAPDKASDALAIIEQNARQAVEELHRTLEALRTQDSSVSPSHSASTLGVDRIPDLIADAEQAGTPTSFEILGEPREVTPMMGLTLYRVTQEALTNVRKHAGDGARATVLLLYEANAVTLEVGNLGGRRSGITRNSSGMGQLGMRERVTALGGTFHAELNEGGYLLRVSVPL